MLEGGTTIKISRCYMLLRPCVYMLSSNIVTCVAVAQYDFCLVLFCNLKQKIK